jgi:hypothetical protein
MDFGRFMGRSSTDGRPCVGLVFVPAWHAAPAAGARPSSNSMIFAIITLARLVQNSRENRGFWGWKRIGGGEAFALLQPC